MYNEQITNPCILTSAKQGNTTLYHCTVPKDLFFFKGHFSNFHIVPGVCQIKWVVDLINSNLKNPIEIIKLEKIKFHNFLLPEQNFIIEITKDDNHWSYLINSEPVTNSKIKFASGKIIIK